MKKRYRVTMRYLCEDVAFVTAYSASDAIGLAEEYIADPNAPEEVEVEITGDVVRHYQPKAILETDSSRL